MELYVFSHLDLGHGIVIVIFGKNTLNLHQSN